MADVQALLDTLSGFARTVTSGYDVSDVLHDLNERVTQVLHLSGAGVSLLQDDRLRHVAALDESVTRLEQLQESHQAGPCVDATNLGHPVAVDDLRDGAWAARWPDYCAAAATLGIVAVAGVPMTAGDRAVGSIDLYDRQPRRWAEEDLQAATTLADIATAYVVNASELEQQRRTAEQLQRALDSRIVIEQAKGILSAANGVSVDEAFQLLRRHARGHNARIHEVAAAVVHLGLRP